MSKHLKPIINAQDREGNCQTCNSSCQTACKTSITVTNQGCENKEEKKSK